MNARQQGRTLQAMVTVALVAIVSSLVYSQAPRTVQDGVYSDAQAARGQALYATSCAGCHGGSLECAQAPPLKGDGFVGVWQAQPLSELAGKIRNTMPQGAEGTLTPPQTADLVAHILKAGGFPAGGADLAPAEATLSRITWPERRVAAATAAGAAAGQPKVYPPLGNMA